ncbi:hypothetical protein CK203_045160, partial [Vitis vinifera]
KQGKRALRNFAAVKETSAKWHFVAKPFRNTVEASARYFAAAKVVWHTSATSQYSSIHLAAAKHCEMEKHDFAPKVPFRRVFRNCESGFGTRVPLRSTVTSISQLRNSLRSCCENGNCCEIGVLAPFSQPLRLLQSHAVQLRSSSLSNAGQSSIAQNGANTRAKSSSPSNRKRSLRKEPLPESAPEAFAVETKSTSGEAAPPKPPARRYLTRSEAAIEEETQG